MVRGTLILAVAGFASNQTLGELAAAMQKEPLNPANVTFFQTHKAEVQAFQKAMDALEPPQ